MHRVVKQAARGLAPALLKRELLALSGETLRDAVRALILLGVLMHENGGDASELFAMVESAEVIAALDRASASRIAEQGEASLRARRRFTRFAGERITEAVTKSTSGMRLGDFGARRFLGLKLR